ncbi:MAG: manganese efflux pump [Clostridia bacterium]|nr:manganese efflux pump [Clostridia bacterium]
MFFINAALLGVGLAMDAFSVSVANGLREPDMKKRKALLSSAVFGGFQTAMPLLGWICVHTLLEAFESFRRFIPWIALALLLVIGVKMIVDGIRGTAKASGAGMLLVQGIATSIDALSVGLTIAEFSFGRALVEALIIGAITFGICIAGIYFGRKAGSVISDKASVFGGVILVIIGLEIFIKGVI